MTRNPIHLHTPWLLALALSGAAHAAEPLRLSAAQVEAAGIVTRPAQVAPGGTVSGLLLQGTVQLPSQASDVVSAPVAGVVQAVWVSPGQVVRAGTPVARLLSPQLVEWQRDWLQAEAQWQLAAEKLRRDEQLFAEGIIAQLRLSETRTQHRLAQVALDERRQALQLAGVTPQQLQGKALNAGLTLVAPAAGAVLELDATPGQRLEAGMPVARLARAGRLALELQASQDQVRQLKVGDALAVEGCKTPARLTAITPQVSASTQAALLRAEFNSAENCLRVNQFVTAQPLRPADAASRAIELPNEAVVQHQGQSYVFVRQAQGFVPTAIQAVPSGGASVRVTRGLSVGAEVAVRGTAALKGVWQGLGAEAEATPASKAP